MLRKKNLALNTEQFLNGEMGNFGEYFSRVQRSTQYVDNTIRFSVSNRYRLITS
jgi:hypothetical protein